MLRRSENKSVNINQGVRRKRLAKRRSGGREARRRSAIKEKTRPNYRSITGNGMSNIIARSLCNRGEIIAQRGRGKSERENGNN